MSRAAHTLCIGASSVSNGGNVWWIVTSTQCRDTQAGAELSWSSVCVRLSLPGFQHQFHGALLKQKPSSIALPLLYCNTPFTFVHMQVDAGATLLGSEAWGDYPMMYDALCACVRVCDAGARGLQPSCCCHCCSACLQLLPIQALTHAPLSHTLSSAHTLGVGLVWLT